MRGRKPKPNAIKELSGSRWASDEPALDDSKPACPPWLTDEAKVIWRYHAGNLHSAGLLKKTDRDTFAAYCESVADFQRATERLQREGAQYVFRNYNGTYQENPYVYQKNRAMEKMLKFAAEFGMSPSARSRFKVEQPKTDPLNDFFGRLAEAEKARRG